MKKLMGLLFVLIAGVVVWMVFTIATSKSDVIVNANQEQAVNQEQSVEPAEPPAPALEPQPVAPPSLPADQEEQLRTFASGLHTFTSALTLDSVVTRCADNLTYCAELHLLRAFAQQAPASYGQVGDQAQLLAVIDQVGEAYKTGDRATIERGLNGLIAVTNNLSVAVNGMQ